MKYGFVKVAAATPRIKVANPYFNAERALDVIKKCAEKKAKITAHIKWLLLSNRKKFFL